MRDNHIISLLEAKPFGGLSAGERAQIEAHAADCSACMRAYAAARVAATMMNARAAETVEPSPFFKTRVMAAIRERQLSTEQPALVRMWKAAGALVSMMAALLVILLGLTFFNYPAEPQPSPDQIAIQTLNSPEWVLFEADDPGVESAEYDLVLTTLYGSEDADGN